MTCYIWKYPILNTPYEVHVEKELDESYSFWLYKLRYGVKMFCFGIYCDEDELETFIPLIKHKYISLFQDMIERVEE